jgi:transcriptional regulator with XRE-family HTH domain
VRGKVSEKMDSFPPLTLGSLIKTRRLALGLNQEAVATRMVAHGDVTFRQTDVSRLELGKVALPRRERVAHLAAVLELPLDELIAAWAGCATPQTPGQALRQRKATASEGEILRTDPGPVATPVGPDEDLLNPPRRPGWTDPANWRSLLAESEELRITSRHLRAQSMLRVERAQHLHAEVVAALAVHRGPRLDRNAAETPSASTEPAP